MNEIEEIKAAISAGDVGEDQMVSACKAVVAECNTLRERVEDMAEELDAARAELAAVQQASEDAFIEDLKCKGVLAPKDEAMEGTWRGLFGNDPDGARLMASKMKVPGTETIAGGKAGSVEDGRSAADMFQDDLKDIL